MTREEYLKELNKAFGDFKFFEQDHHYEYKGQRVGISVTTFIHEYANEFNEQEMAEKSAIKNNKSVQEILDEWHYKRDFSCEKGTTCHEWSQHLWSGNEYNELLFDGSIEYINAVNKIQNQAKNFKKDYEDRLEHLYDELPIGSEEFNIASCVDHLFYNKLTGDLVLVDYKTNSYLKGYNEKAYKKSMKVPLQHLNDDSLHHYYLQLSIYKFLIEKYANVKVEEMFIVYFSENIKNYEIIPIPYMEKEVEEILENRRCKNMKSIPVLLYGKSGSGKTSSFRNYKNDEIAYINILDKPLPFKSDIKINSLDNYDKIIAGIKGTKKKTIVIDDAGFLLTNEMFERARETGYTKFTQIAEKFYNLIKEIKKIDGGKVVVISMHEEIEEGQVKLKTAGKMIESNGVIEGNFTIAIRTMCDNGKYVFRLKNTGCDITKTPIGLFDDGVEEIENDFKIVDKAIRDYYELDKVEEKKEGEK